MILDDAQKESSSERALVGEIFTKISARHHHLDLGDREGCLRETGFVLSKDDLALIRVRLVAIVDSVRYDSVIFLSRRYIFLVREPWSGRDYCISMTATPTDIHTIQTNKLFNS